MSAYPHPLSKSVCLSPSLFLCLPTPTLSLGQSFSLFLCLPTLTLSLGQSIPPSLFMSAYPHTLPRLGQVSLSFPPSLSMSAYHHTLKRSVYLFPSVSLCLLSPTLPLGQSLGLSPSLFLQCLHTLTLSLG